MTASAGSRLAWLLPVAVGVVCYAVFLFAPQVLNDPDTWWHIAAGEWMLRHGAVPRVDPFSFTFAGKPWVAHEWLAEVLMALAYRAGGWDAVLALEGGAAALAFGLLARHLARWANRLAVLLLLLLALACTSPSLLVRPHILALPALEIWTAGLLIARSRATTPSPLLLPVMLIWVNLHGSFVFGIALAVPLALEALTTAAPDDRARVARGWGLFIVAAVIVAMASPQLWQGLIFPFRLIRMRALPHIGEWQPTNFSEPQPIELALMALLYVALSRGVRVPALRLLIVMGLLHLALAHARHQMLAGVVGALILADPLGRALGRGDAAPDAPRNRDRRDAGWIGAGLAILLALTVVRGLRPVVRADGAASPIPALAHVPPALARSPVFNDYAFGGYLIFNGISPFVDGRADMYGDAFLAGYLRIMRPDIEAFRMAVDKYGIRWTILRTGTPIVDVLDALPGWHRLYADPAATIHVRSADAP